MSLQKQAAQSIQDHWCSEPIIAMQDIGRQSISVPSAFSGTLNARTFDQESIDGDSTQVSQIVNMFNHLSSQLTESYRNLENRVGQLNGELSEEVQQRRKELEEKERVANRLETLLRLLPAAVVVLDGHGVIQQCNDAAIDLLGEPLEGERWLDVIQRCFSPRHDDGHEVSLKDGRRVSIAIRSMDNTPGQLILLTDLTETRQLQAQLSRSERLSSMGRMVASLAHQVRTPLSTAMLYAGHLCQSEIDDEMRIKCATKLMSRLTHLEQQVRDMLIFARGETPMAERVCIDEIKVLLEQAADAPVQSSNSHIEWDNRCHGEYISCNRDALIGACMNLINNSIEAVKGEAHIRVCLTSVPGERVAITVEDNGPGLPDTDTEQVLEAFYTTKSQGTGLGLAVVQAVAKAHKGVFSLNNRNQPERGVIATLILPAQCADVQ
ncbi:sensor histidine kinase [Oleiphilus messinensis]|nr:ATP-binding protein [Oleiphilus messinensis]